MGQAFSVELHDRIYVQRDDIIYGGTKRRALDILLPKTPQTDLAYAGTIFGHGALALALAAQEQGKQAHLFLSANDTDHPMVQSIKKTNAVIHLCEPLPVSDLLAYATQCLPDAYIFPLAFDTPAFHAAMTETLKDFDIAPYSELWCSSVSGTLARALKAAFPHTPLKIVSVVKSGTADFTAPEKYHQPAKTPPPYPSCPYTDAKVWQFAAEHAKPGALIWNIAG